MNPFADNPQLARMAEMLQFAVAMPRHPKWAQIGESIQNELLFVFSGAKTPKEAMATAAKAANELLME